MKAYEIESFDAILDDAERQASNDWEMDFVSDIRDKYRKYDDNMFVSEKQLEQLKRIADWD